MTRIDELQKKYPLVPLEVIVKWETLNRGIRDNEDLDKAGEWLRRGGVGTYQSYDHDVTLKDAVGTRSNRVKPGHMLRPRNFYMKRGIGAKVQLSTTSPYQIKDSGDGQLGLFEGEEKVDIDIYFPEKPVREEAVTSKGTRVSDLVGLIRSCFSVIPVRHCEYFNTGDQCKFCNFNTSQEDARSIGIERTATINLEDAAEAFKITGSQVRLVEGRFEMGGFMHSENEGRVYFDFVEKLAGALPYKPNFKVTTQAMSRKDMQRLKDVGLDCMAIQLEVWDPRLFPVILPGKASHCSREQWLEAFLDAVDVLGPGNVAGKIIGGLTLIPENGHKTWQEARDVHIEGNNWLIKNGVFPLFTVLRLPPGSVYAEDPANRTKLPPTEYYLDVAEAHHAAMKEYGLYGKLNKLLICGLCCTAGPYMGDIGVLELAGNVGNWMADAVPEGTNWLAEFISSIDSPTK